MAIRGIGGRRFSPWPGSGGGKDPLPTLIAILALSASAYSIWLSRATRNDIAAVDTIKSEYQLFSDLAKASIEHPAMAHMFTAPPSIYDVVKQRVSESLVESPKQRGSLLLEERGIAEFIFNAFEQTFYSWRHAQQVRDEERATFLRGDLDYFAVLLCNPRLKWYWGDGRLGKGYYDDLQAFYRSDVFSSCVVDEDKIGPYGVGK